MLDIKLVASAVCLFYWLTQAFTYRIHFPQERQNRAKLRPTYRLSGLTKTFKTAAGFLYSLVLIRILSIPLLEISIEKNNLILGSVLCAFGILLLNKSLKELGLNYAPSYAGVLPERRVMTGPHRYFAHPMYISNLVLLAGVWITAGGFLLGAIWLVFALFYATSIKDEERAFEKTLYRLS